ncbi:MAG: serine/threonine protein phosphatase [Caulobacterales bacterium]|nr:serine/threonine protein phosphatase [Caulobacterales bacterium]
MDDRAVFAVGDIHGCNDLLTALLDTIAEASPPGGRRPLLIFLGDYVDRGPDSKGVIERLTRIRADQPEARFLCGNHEETMLRFLSDFDSGLAWTSYGGRETMLSYGVTPPRDKDDLEGWRRAQQAFKAAIPDTHLKFLWGLEDRVEVGDYLFAHAGVRPDRPLNAQTAHDLRWIREPFLSHGRRLAKVIVHGHTPETEPFSDERRIGVDTWAYRTGVLTAVELDGESRRFIQARRGGGSIGVADTFAEIDA